MVSLCLHRKAGESSSRQGHGSKFKSVITRLPSIKKLYIPFLLYYTSHLYAKLSRNILQASSMSACTLLKGSRICNYFNDLRKLSSHQYVDK
jgi:hypothetical protein